MRSRSLSPPYLLTPEPYLIAYVFFALTSFHLYSRFLMSLHLELVLLIVCLAITAINLSIFGSVRVTNEGRVLTLLCLGLMGAPLVSSLVNGGTLEVMTNAEYLSWVKMLLVGPILFLTFSRGNRESLLWLLIVALGLLALVFWYRFAVLGEIRELDLRPKLQMKNGDPNFLCLLFATGIPLLLYRINRGLSRASRLALALDIFLLGLFASVVIASESRMGILSMVLGLSLLVFSFPSFRKIGLLIFSTVVAVCVAYGGILERFLDISDLSNQMRLKSMWTGAQLFATHPLFGHGWDSAPAHFFSFAGYPRLMSETFPLQVHNTPLQLLAELGIYGFAAYGALLIFVWSAVKRADVSFSPFGMAALLTLSLNLLTLPLQNKDFVLCLAISIAALSSSISQPAKAAGPTSARLSKSPIRKPQTAKKTECRFW